MSYLLLIVFTMVLGFGTQAYIKSSYRKYSQVDSGTGETGAMAARRMLDDHGLNDVRINCVPGELSDHYDPSNRTVNLSEDVYHGRSIAATAVACHECGHAVQHATGYQALQVRTMLFPVANFGSNAWIILLMIGIFLNITGLVWLAIALYAFAVLFQLVTLPVEFNASKRALAYIEGGAGPLVRPGAQTLSGAKTVLTAAALTYVAAALTSIAQLLYYVGMLNNNDE